MDQVFLDTKEIPDHSAIKSVRNVKIIGQEQYHAFTKECGKNQAYSRCHMSKQD